MNSSSRASEAGPDSGPRVLHRHNTAQLLLPIKAACPNSARGGKHTRLHSSALGGPAMGESLLLLSCGAAFITGLVIAAASLFG